jgi:hypothetical protein
VHLIFRACHADVPGNPVILPGAFYNKLCGRTVAKKD